MSFINKFLKPIVNGYRQRPKYQRMIIILSAIYLSFTALLGLLVPYIAVQQVPKQLSALILRPVTLEDVKINPFTLEVVIDRFKIYETDNQDFVGFNQLSFEYQFWHSLYNTAFSIADVTLTAPSANIERIAAKQTLRFNFSDIIETLANRAKEQADNREANPEQNSAAIPHFIVSNLSIVNADLNFIDEVTNSQLHYPQLNLDVAYFDSKHAISTSLNNLGNAQQTNHYALQITGRKGGEIATQGLVQLSPLNIVGDLQLSNIQLPQFWSFISEQFAPTLTSGHLSLSTHYQLQLQDDKLQFLTNQGLLQLADINFEYRKQSIVNLPMIALKGIAFDFNQQSVSAELLDTKGLVVNAKLNKSGIDLAQLFTPITSQASTNSANQQSKATIEVADTKQQPAAESRPWHAVLSAIELKDYQVNISEQLLTKNTQWQIDDINFSTGVINADLATPIDYQLALNINQQGTVKSSGSVDAIKQKLNAKLAVIDFSLPQLQAYLSPYVNINLKKGDFSTQGSVSFDAKSKQAIYSGTVDINDLLIKDTVQKKELLKWQALTINQLTFDRAANSLSIDHIALNKPFGRIIIAKDKTTNIGDLIVTEQTTGEQTTTNQAKETPAVAAKLSSKQHESASPLALTINKISVKDGSTFFADNSLTPNFAASIEHLEGEISKLSSSSEQTASVDIKGKIDRYAPVSLKGDINPLLAQPYLDLALSFKHVELTSVNPYSGTYAGYYIDKGLLSLDLNYKLDKNQLVGDNHLVVDQLKLGKPSDSSLATTLPVTLAIALLQDRHGVIDLGLQVSGDVDDPSFSIGSIVMTAFTNVITKAVTAPFSLLAGLLGDDADELDKISFDAGQASLDDQQQATLDKLAKGLSDRPMLTLSVEGGVNMPNDSQAMSELRLQTKLAQIAKINIDQLPQDLSASRYPTQGPLPAALISLYETEIGSPAELVKDKIEAEHQGEQQLTDEQLTERWHIALYNFALSAQRVSEQALGKLAQSRANAVKTYLIEQKGIAPERVFLLDSRVELNTGASQALLTLGAN
ncbi:hypothetical protein TUM4438_33670 [Shewanella sairae]|uniref:DUF748 domain-containing protein n=1 Tax=Shewanella sairae TaxID=190310 RepID=A0ABQ4PMT0_9GAMM|nr:DUF748 domain-containing protein [Shewanella sairae]MCL1130238.1 DUF748 domain-containing protein [Shewanella sairae]GIU49634.1 hypothetical protein TUM4438_33670 [Shewanella sairae]